MPLVFYFYFVLAVLVIMRARKVYSYCVHNKMVDDTELYTYQVSGQKSFALFASDFNYLFIYCIITVHICY